MASSYCLRIIVASEWKNKVGVFNKVANEWQYNVGVSNKVAIEKKHRVEVFLKWPVSVIHIGQTGESCQNPHHILRSH